MVRNEKIGHGNFGACATGGCWLKINVHLHEKLNLQLQ